MWLEDLLIWSHDTIWLGVGLEEGIDVRYLTSLLLRGHVLPPPPFLPLPSTTSMAAPSNAILPTYSLRSTVGLYVT